MVIALVAGVVAVASALRRRRSTTRSSEVAQIADQLERLENQIGELERGVRSATSTGWTSSTPRSRSPGKKVGRAAGELGVLQGQLANVAVDSSCAAAPPALARCSPTATAIDDGPRSAISSPGCRRRGRRHRPTTTRRCSRISPRSRRRWRRSSSRALELARRRPSSRGRGRRGGARHYEQRLAEEQGRARRPHRAGGAASRREAAYAEYLQDQKARQPEAAAAASSRRLVERSSGAQRSAAAVVRRRRRWSAGPAAVVGRCRRRSRRRGRRRRSAAPVAAAPCRRCRAAPAVAVNAAMSQRVFRTGSRRRSRRGLRLLGPHKYAWGVAGVDLPHQSAAQYASTPHVPKEQAQPGDLIFYYSPIGHVGIYLGGGAMVHAAADRRRRQGLRGQLEQGRRRRPPRLIGDQRWAVGRRRPLRSRSCKGSIFPRSSRLAAGQHRRRRSRRSPFELIAGGRSNLTFRVDGRRRPAVRAAPAAARSRARHRARHGPRAPHHRRRRHDGGARAAGARAVHRRGRQRRAVLRDGLRRRRRARQRREGRRCSPVELRRAASEHLIDVLADLHAVDIDAVGLGDFAQARGLHRAAGEAVDDAVGELQDPRAAGDRRGRRRADASGCPVQQGVAIAHGDYRFGNCLTDVGRARIAAVLDWELCTLGDPLADVGYLGVYWFDGDDAAPPRANDPTSAGGFPPYDELARALRDADRPRRLPASTTTSRSRAGGSP